MTKNEKILKNKGALIKRTVRNVSNYFYSKWIDLNVLAKKFKEGVIQKICDAFGWCDKSLFTPICDEILLKNVTSLLGWHQSSQICHLVTL